MRLIQNKPYGNKGQIHRIDGAGNLACNSHVNGGRYIGAKDAPLYVNPRRLCGNCFNTRAIKVLANPNSRIVT